MSLLKQSKQVQEQTHTRTPKRIECCMFSENWDICKSSVSVCTPWWPRLAAPHFFFFFFFFDTSDEEEGGIGGRRWRRASRPIGRHVSHSVNTSLEKKDARLGRNSLTTAPPRFIQLITHLMYLWHYSEYFTFMFLPFLEVIHDL